MSQAAPPQAPAPLPGPPTLQDVLRILKANAQPNTALIYRRHGVTDETWGVPYGATAQVLKLVKQDHALALELWETGVHEARVLATKLANPEQLTRAQLDAWLGDVTDYVVDNAVSGLAARCKDALALARGWIDARKEWPTSAGWNVIGLLAMEGRLPAADAKVLLARIHKDLRKSPNRTRHAMNGALISIGGAMKEFTQAALDVARAIGKVEVDHGLTGCVTPEAAPYIERMLEHAAARKRPPPPPPPAEKKKVFKSPARPAAGKAAPRPAAPARKTKPARKAAPAAKGKKKGRK